MGALLQIALAAKPWCAMISWVTLQSSTAGSDGQERQLWGRKAQAPGLCA